MNAIFGPHVSELKQHFINVQLAIYNSLNSQDQQKFVEHIIRRQKRLIKMASNVLASN